MDTTNFSEDCEFCAQHADTVMREFCPTVERIIEDPVEGEAMIGYFPNGERAFKVLFDQFEVPVMKMAIERGRLKEYILAANGLTEEDAKYLANQ